MSQQTTTPALLQAKNYRTLVILLCVLGVAVLFCPLELPALMIFSCFAGCPGITDADILQAALYCGAVSIVVSLVSFAAAFWFWRKARAERMQSSS
jgi:hypothetical protein